jgi:hypothetical protein
MGFGDAEMTHRRAPLLAVLTSIVLVAAACTSPARTPDTTGEPGSEIVISNEGGENEGHTPIGFAGMGTGLFAGDNLNSRFPEGDGVQTFMTFALPVGITVAGATLRSGVLQTRGTPFTDLGALTVERVTYDQFGPDLFDLPGSGERSVCTVVGGTAVECDVTNAAMAAASEGATSIQFRLRFEQVADNDGQADLAMFYRSESNTNEQGLFTLVITES